MLKHPVYSNMSVLVVVITCCVEEFELTLVLDSLFMLLKIAFLIFVSE